MPKISFAGNPVINDGVEDNLYKIVIKHPIFVRGVEISISVPKEDVKQTMEDLAEIVSELE